MERIDGAVADGFVPPTVNAKSVNDGNRGLDARLPGACQLDSETNTCTHHEEAASQVAGETSSPPMQITRYKREVKNNN